MLNEYIAALASNYRQAAYFTDAPEDGSTPEFTFEFAQEAYAACEKFTQLCKVKGINLSTAYPHMAEQIGHDLWLTRNGHGAGFWDRPYEMYGMHRMTFTDLARSMGQHYAEFQESN